MLRRKLKYRFDNLMSRGTAALVVFLFSVTAFVVILAGFIAMLLDSTEHSFLHSIWKNFMYTLDGGNLSGAEGNTAFLVIALLVTLCGLFFTSVLIGIINSGIENKMTELQRGKSVVFERDHIVMLGFGETAILILKQLVISGENQRRQVIVILDDKRKADIENEIRLKIPDPKTTRFVCRSGKPSNIFDLKMCSPETCRCVIVTCDDDYSSLQAILAMSKIIDAHECPGIHITTTVNDTKNIDAMRIAGAGRVETINLQRTISRIIAHSCLQPGISAVFTELFNFEGNEIYVEAIAGAAGMRFDRANLRFCSSTLIGLVRNGKPMVNPPSETIINNDDKLILIAADDGVSSLADNEGRFDPDAFADALPACKRPLKLLILGNSPLLLEILSEEDKYLISGSQIKIAFPPDDPTAYEQLERIQLSHSETIVVPCDIYSRECLEKLLTDEIDNVLVLSDLSVSRNESDTKNMMLLLYLRDIAVKRGLRFSMTTEIQNTENQKLISSRESSDYVISRFITAMITAQVSQTRQLAAIFTELLNEEGSEVYLRPAAEYVSLDAQVDFYTASASTARRNEVFIGYRKKVAPGQYETRINPAKAERIMFSPDDDFIVLAES